ncbi:serine hydrolase domain-containing protein [Eisenibacter elegans]|uniref:serine hydrolase domain-containing protein n=1 Tax=Eisenibacter elegans TaxID=997 RepID=UPI0004204A72|nr:serine hydrolase domain-containing protein [Eisenibacter elegans]
MPRLPLLFVLLLCLSCWSCQTGASAERPPQYQIAENAPEHLGIILKHTLLHNTQGAHPEFKQMTRMLAQFTQQNQLAGLSVAVMKDGRLVYAQGFGYADSLAKLAMEPYHRLRVASVSKLITAVAVMKLVEQQQITLDTKVFGKDGILNDLKYQTAIADERIYDLEVVHLLEHTGGWRNRFRSDPMFKNLEVAQAMGVPPPADFETTICFMLGEKLVAAPGAFYDYSNFGYSLLGEIVAKVSGMSYDDFVQKAVLKPIGAAQTHAGKTRAEQLHPLETYYYEQVGAPKRLSVYGTGDSASRVYEGTYMEALLPAGGWVTTPADLLRLVAAIDPQNPRTKILSPASIERMVTPRDTTQRIYLGWKQCAPEQWVRTGSLASTSAVVCRLPNGISWAIITNTGPWRGPFFVYDLQGIMRRGLQTIRDFPADRDLFARPE